MLRPCSREEFEKYADFAYELAMDPSKSAYPTYCDRIKTKAMFLERASRAFERETEEMLLFEYEGDVQGLIHYYRIPEDSYLQTICFNVNRAADRAITEFLAYIGERFHDYDAYFGFPAENREAVKTLRGYGFECIEDDYNNTALLDGFEPLPLRNTVRRITRENYESFAALHRKTEGDMYWNSERILADLDGWTVFVNETDGEAQGAVYYRDVNDGWFEIFGIDILPGLYDPALFKDLLSAALSEARRKGGRFMTFFCEAEYEEAAKECGFFCVGNYLCFKTHID
ncbi:MAG: hypothetical protein J5496_09195 [Lachnospiraceae bacterium]|nr:hypothetical protein [Lachnospiraceae bacterium]